MEEDSLGFVDILIEDYEGFEDGDEYVKKSYLFINGEPVQSNGDHITAILEYLKYECTVNYI